MRREPLLQRWERAVLDGVDAVGADTPAGRRLRDTADFFEFLQAEMPAMLERWRVSALIELPSGTLRKAVDI